MGWTGSPPNQTFLRTDGTRTGTEVWQEAEGAGVNIISSDHDVHDQDQGDGINDCLKKDGGNQPTADIPWNNNLITGYGDPDSRTNAARVAEVQDSAHAWGGTAGGTADALTLSLSPSISSYTTGIVVWFIASAANTSSATLDIDSVGATTLKKTDGTTDLAAGDIVSGRLYGALYDGTNFQVLNLDTAGTVDTAQLADNAVTSAKIATDAVGADQIASGAVDTDELATDAVTAAKIAAGAVDTSELAAESVTAAKIADAAINAIAKIASAIRSGLDATLITGTAGTNGNLGQWNADGDLVDGPDVLDEDDMSSDSASAVATQQSVKAYVDSSVSGIVTREVFASNGTWNKPSTGTIAFIEVWGGGGGGGDQPDNGAGGGGGYNYAWIPLSDLGSSESVTVGAGGAPDNAGEDSSFGSHVTGFHGGACTSDSSAGGGGGGQLSGGGDATGSVGASGGSPFGGVGGDSGPGGNGNSGGGGDSSQPGGDGIYGGAGGGGTTANGGDSLYGGAGGGGTSGGSGGTSVHGGDGGDDQSDGSAPGGGGGANGSGARGEVRVTVW